MCKQICTYARTQGLHNATDLNVDNNPAHEGSKDPGVGDVPDD